MAASKPAEELYDLAADPYETNNLAADPQYATDLARLRQALDEWETTYPDLGMIPEEELLESWRPGGEFKVTEPPEIVREDGRLVASCPTEGASIGWTTDPPGARPQPATDFLGLSDKPATGGGAGSCTAGLSRHRVPERSGSSRSAWAICRAKI